MSCGLIQQYYSVEQDLTSYHSDSSCLQHTHSHSKQQQIGRRYLVGMFVGKVDRMLIDGKDSYPDSVEDTVVVVVVVVAAIEPLQVHQIQYL